MKIIVNEEDLIYIENSIINGEILKEDLGRWFKEKWVDVSKKVDGKYPPCGRSSSNGEKGRKAYPKCRPSKKVSKSTPKIASSYDKKEKKSMTTQKRRAEKKDPKIGKGNTPTFTRFDENIVKLNEDQIAHIVLNVIEDLKKQDIGPKVKLNESSIVISESIQYHINNDLPIHDNIYRIYSNKFFNLYNEARILKESGVVEFFGDDEELLNTNIGQTGIFEGNEVYLDVPFIENEEEYLVEAKHRGRNVKLNKPFRTPGGPKKFAVYVKTPGGTIKKVTFGDPNLRVRNNNKKAAKSFRARHKCSQKKDRTTAGYWSCNISRYRKALGIKSKNPW